MKQDDEKIVGKIIHNRLSIEWMRYNMFSLNNIYKNIPMLVFRVNKTSENEQLKRLEECVASFQGKNSWKLFKDPLSVKGNYLLTIAIIENIRKECREKHLIYNEKEYFGDDMYKSYCERAIQDIPFLAEHIDKCFS